MQYGLTLLPTLRQMHFELGYPVIVCLGINKHLLYIPALAVLSGPHIRVTDVASFGIKTESLVLLQVGRHNGGQTLRRPLCCFGISDLDGRCI